MHLEVPQPLKLNGVGMLYSQLSMLIISEEYLQIFIVY